VSGAKIGVYAIDLGTGAVLAASGEHLALNPASNAKLYTASAALALLHPEHRYETTLSGKVKDGAVAPLILRGFGDPSLSSEDLHAMARELHDRGIKRVDDILVDQKFFDDKTTPPAFDQKPSEWAAFRAPVSAIAVNENTITLTVRPAGEGQTAHAWFDPPGFVDVEGSVATAGPGTDTVTLTLSPSGQRMSAKIGGSIGSDARLVRYARRVEDPALLAGYVLRAALDDVGIKFAGDIKLGTVAKAPLLVRHTSEPLSSLVTRLGKESDNFYAEMIFKSIAAETKSPPAKAEDAAQIVTKWVIDIGAHDTGLVIKNGSGLYDADRTTAFAVVKLLEHAYKDPDIAPDFVAQLAIGGADGTLRKRFRNVKNHRAIRAKTGTLEGTVSLSGYVLGPPGKAPIAFSILMNDVEGHVADARGAIDKFVARLAQAQATGKSP
jgi:D-alanyl-D-alanine carboxypeptidase/D-alanyl-D-alanine-endopeptidase (penicillin-binding protein 4)